MAGRSGSPSAHLEKPLIDIAVESWRFAKLFVRLLGKLDAGDGARYGNQHRYYLDRLEDSLEQAGMRFADLEGSAYDPGASATALSLAHFGAAVRLLGEQMAGP